MRLTSDVLPVAVLDSDAAERRADEIAEVTQFVVSPPHSEHASASGARPRESKSKGGKHHNPSII